MKNNIILFVVRCRGRLMREGQTTRNDMGTKGKRRRRCCFHRCFTFFVAQEQARRCDVFCLQESHIPISILLAPLFLFLFAVMCTARSTMMRSPEAAVSADEQPPKAKGRASRQPRLVLSFVF